MKHHWSPVAAALAAAGVALPSQALAAPYNPPEASARGRVILLEPLAFVKVDDLDFGTYLIPSSGSGTVRLNPIDAGLTFTGSVTPMPTSAPQRGRFTGSGGPGYEVSVTAVLPDKLYIDGDPANTAIDVSIGLNHMPDSNGVHSYIINAQKVFNVYVGGQLTIQAGQQPGLYSNEYVVTATYL